MAKFTKLNIGDAVASGSGRAWKKLSVESAEDNSIVGTWVFNNNVNYPSISKNYLYSANVHYSSSSFGSLNMNGSVYKNLTFSQKYGGQYIGVRLTKNGITLGVKQNSNDSSTITDFTVNSNFSITFNENVYLSDVTIDSDLLPWLKANATKQ